MDKFWESLGGKLAERWLSVSSYAVVFWLGALLAWAVGHDGTHRLTAWLSKQQVPVQFLTLVLVLLGVAGTGLAVEQLITPVLRLAEGYWPKPLAAFRERRITRVAERAERDRTTWQDLIPDVLGPGADPSPGRLEEYARIDERLRRTPPSRGQLMPTRTGNILRAAETWPLRKYGLDTLTVWPRLWLLLPDVTRSGLLQARGALNRAVSILIWGGLFCLLTPWTWYALPVGITAMAIAWTWTIPDRAAVYADLLESAFDLHRGLLYESLRWPLPTDPADEHTRGRELTIYLRRGSDKNEPTFTQPPIDWPPLRP